MGVKEVAAGAAWLDENFPGWEREIDLGTLDMSNCSACICGQSLRELIATDENVFDGFSVAVVLGANVKSDWQWTIQHQKAIDWAATHGFALPLKGIDWDDDTVVSNSWKKLENLWLDLIKERFSTGNLSDNG